MNPSSRKIIKAASALLVADILIIWLWAVNSDLPPGSAMAIYIVVPFAFLINMIIGILLFFIKRIYSPVFFINCIVASVITYWFFTLEMRRQYKRHFDIWSFNLKDTTFSITKWNKQNEFDISYSESPGFSTSFLEGKCEQKKDTLLLTTDSTKMYILDHKLHNFRTSEKPITLTIKQ